MKKPLDPLRLRLIWQTFGWVLVAIVTGLSLMPEPPSMPTILSWDKGQHMAAYAALMYWFGMAFTRHWRWPKFLLAWGLLMEVIQGVGGLRTMDPYDMVANLLGVAGGMLILQTPCARFLSVLDKAIAGRGDSRIKHSGQRGS